jgi:hypothetical protein
MMISRALSRDFGPHGVAIISLQFEVTSLARFIDIDAIRRMCLGNPRPRKESSPN